MTTPWQQRYSQRMKWMGSSIIRELLKLTEKPDIISFAGGLPAPEVFPVKEFEAATQQVLAEHGSRALQYGTTEGYGPLREYIVRRMSRYGIEAEPENVLITSGSQQALDLIGKILINPGDLILTEQPTYVGAIQAWRAYQAEFATVPIDDEGLRTDLLEEALCAGPKFMYILPNFQNPAGVTLSLKRRMKLLEIADRYGIPIIEDDPYGQLRYEGDHLPSLVALDAQKLNGRGVSGNGMGFFRGNVIYLSTFSKTLAPGLRLGWVVAPKEVIKRCVMGKQGMDLHTSTFVQMVAYEVIKDGFLDEHVRHIRRVYRERRDVMLAAMERYFPPEVHWTIPAGGLFLWITLPESLNTTQLLEKAVENKVAYVPGSAFDPAGDSLNTARLNFSNARPENIELGIKRLGQVFETAIQQGLTRETSPIVTDVQLLGVN
ncbi:MAG: PLP-dependent aminotransferase family protein [Ardenticatenaceae bacterium]|nr:PLP-dependent aminotransferase family protein [Anaerolineales bacterium]MCB8918300.1 PLP-dependent aminotransferase family protein [Ardenticatenaceae bacterium]